MKRIVATTLIALFAAIMTVVPAGCGKEEATKMEGTLPPPPENHEQWLEQIKKPAKSR